MASLFVVAASLAFSARAVNVTFAWNPNTETDLAGYKLYYGPASRTYTNHVTLGTVTNHTLANLVDGATYYFALTAVNTNADESDYSTELHYPNLPPTLASIANRNLNEDAGQQTVNLSGISPGAGESQALQITATSGNPSLIPNPSVSYTNGNATGVLRFTPVANANGSALITVTVTDGQSQNNTATQTFTVTVQASNDPPALALIAPQTVPEDTAATFSLHVTDIDTAIANLSLSAVSSNLTLVPISNISFSGGTTNRTMVVTPAANRSGSATLVITVSDGSLTATRSVLLTVNAAADQPSISGIANVTTDEDVETPLIPFTVSDPETPSTNLTVRAASNNTSLIPTNRIFLSGTNGARNVRLQPATNQNGSASVTLTVSDGTLTSSTTFTFTVRPVNDAPTITQITDRNLNEDVQTNPITFTVDDLDSPLNSLQVTAASSSPGIVPVQNIFLAGTNGLRNVVVRPATNAVGSSVIALTVSDGQASASEPFTVTYLAVNDAPDLTTPPDLSVTAGAPVPLILFNVRDPESAISTVTLSFSSSNTALLPVSGITLGGTGTNRTLRLAPTTNQVGSSRVGITATDGSATNRVFFLFTVTPSNPGNALEVWRANYFTTADLQDPTKEATIWGDLADPDSDGRHNLMEFALGLNPLASEPQEFAFVSQHVNFGGNQYLTLTFNSRINEPLIQYIPEVSSDNAVWSATTQRTAVTPLNAEFERVTYQDTVPITSQAARFIRLRVVLNSP